MSTAFKYSFSSGVVETMNYKTSTRGSERELEGNEVISRRGALALEIDLFSRKELLFKLDKLTTCHTAGNYRIGVNL